MFKRTTPSGIPFDISQSVDTGGPSDLHLKAILKFRGIDSPKSSSRETLVNLFLKEVLTRRMIEFSSEADGLSLLALFQTLPSEAQALETNGIYQTTELSLYIKYCNARIKIVIGAISLVFWLGLLIYYVYDGLFSEFSASDTPDVLSMAFLVLYLLYATFFMASGVFEMRKLKEQEGGKINVSALKATVVQQHKDAVDARNSRASSAEHVV
jgi:hypothetical protein